jgi:U4/U6.U5 tri-snRNP-associated protein 2
MEEPSAKRVRLSSPPALQPEVNNTTKDSGDLYLDTIDRHMLDFDFEKVCSVSLSQINVYACLTCGKYYQGRGKSSHAYFHSMDKDHHVFINLQTLKVRNLMC